MFQMLEYQKEGLVKTAGCAVAGSLVTGTSTFVSTALSQQGCGCRICFSIPLWYTMGVIFWGYESDQPSLLRAEAHPRLVLQGLAM